MSNVFHMPTKLYDCFQAAEGPWVCLVFLGGGSASSLLSPLALQPQKAPGLLNP